MDETRTVSIAPDMDGMREWLRVVARDRDDARVLWGLRMAEACGLTDDYMAAVSEARGWKD